MLCCEMQVNVLQFWIIFSGLQEKNQNYKMLTRNCEEEKKEEKNVFCFFPLQLWLYIMIQTFLLWIVSLFLKVYIAQFWLFCQICDKT